MEQLHRRANDIDSRIAIATVYRTLKLFEETGVFDRDTGQRFLHWILERGGSEEPMVLFEGFRGRKPSVDALLRHSGLSPLEEAA